MTYCLPGGHCLSSASFILRSLCLHYHTYPSLDWVYLVCLLTLPPHTDNTTCVSLRVFRRCLSWALARRACSGDHTPLQAAEELPTCPSACLSGFMELHTTATCGARAALTYWRPNTCGAPLRATSCGTRLEQPRRATWRLKPSEPHATTWCLGRRLYHFTLLPFCCFCSSLPSSIQRPGASLGQADTTFSHHCLT